MKTYIRYVTSVLLLITGLATSGNLTAQIITATSQNPGTAGICIGCGVSNAPAAVDGDLQTYSQLTVNVGVGAQTYQELVFSSAIPANTQSTIKLGTGNNLLSVTLLGGILLRPYNGATAAGPSVSVSSLVSVLSNNNQVTVHLTPSVAYDRIRVTFDGGLVGLLSTIYLYEAYYKDTSFASCHASYDEMHGISSGLLNLGINVGGVVNPASAIDRDRTTASTLNAGVAAVGAFAQLTAVFQPSAPGDSVRVILAIPQALIDVGVLSSVTVSTLNDNTPNNDSKAINSGLLSLRLLDLSGTRRMMTVTFLPQNTFDQVQVKLGGGIASLLSTLDIYEIEKVVQGPVIRFNSIAVNQAQVCGGSPATFTLTAAPNTTYKWYTQLSGGSPVFTGAAFTTPPLDTPITYYAEATRNGCQASTERTSVAITIKPRPVVPTLSLTSVTVTWGHTATIGVTNVLPGVVYNWYDTITGDSIIFTGPSFTTPVLTATATYYVEAVTNGCVSASRAAVAIAVQNLNISVTPPVVTITAGQTAAFTASSGATGVMFNWYTVPSGGLPIFSGAAFTTAPIYTGKVFYVEAMDTLNGNSSPRASATVVVSNMPDITVTPPVRTINPGLTASFTASSTQSGVMFNWYTVPSEGLPVFSGTSFTSPPVYANTTYYVEAVNQTTNAVSVRAPAVIGINGAPDINITPPARTIASGQSTTFTASSAVAGAIFNWYTAPSGGSPAYTGPVFTTPSVYTNTTYYAEAVNPSSGAMSGRVTAVIIINGIPDVKVMPPVRNINPGQFTTFTASSSTPAAMFNWYTTPSGGLPVFSGPVFTTTSIFTNTSFYVEAVDPVTNAVSIRADASITINGMPDVTVIPAVRNINAGQSTTFKASSTTSNAVFNWYTVPSGGTAIFSGPILATPAVNTNTTYYVEAVNPTTNALSARATASITVNDLPYVMVTPPVRNINAGETTSFTALSVTPGVIYKWYTVATGGTSVYTGSVFTTPALSSNKMYYAEAVNPVTNAASLRASASVIINGIPDITITPPVRNISPLQSTSFTASSTTPGAIFKWYTVATGGSSVYTGAVFTTPPLSANTTYYAEAADPVTNAVSVRASASVTVSGTPDITITPPVRNIRPGRTATFTASSTMAGTIFKWYTVPVGGSPVFTGPVFISPALSADAVYYAEAVITATNATSARASAVVFITPAPDVTVTPPVRLINAGQMATFTASSTTPSAVFNWYDASGTFLYTGAVYTSPVLDENTTYYVEAMDSLTNALSDRATALVIINQGNPLIFIPTAFTPNGDGNNDKLQVLGATIADFDMKIFNQWGEMMYSSTDPSDAWDGKYHGENQPAGVYVYYLQGMTGENNRVKKQGTILLIR